jgi:AraC family transcriptional regulator
MLIYSSAWNTVQRNDFDERPRFDGNDTPEPQTAAFLRIDGRSELGRQSRPNPARSVDGGAGDADRQFLDVVPANAVSRRAIGWDGIGVEIIQAITYDKIEFRFHAPCHLLLVYEEGVRKEGETLVGELAQSTLRTLRRKLTFVPAGHEYREWQLPGVRSRVICFYFDPAKMPLGPDVSATAARLAPRLLFENNMLWEMAVKLAAAVEDGAEAERYPEALGIVVAHEVLRVCGKVRRREPLARGGLAVWQQRTVTNYIEEHLAEPISLAELAGLVDLSSYYFCRAFKQSFGVPPHRYHINRRIERAKMLLVDPTRSVTETALAVGFSETSSFSATFRQATGITPTAYRRMLA